MNGFLIVGNYLHRARNLSDLQSAALARNYLNLDTLSAVTFGKLTLGGTLGGVTLTLGASSGEPAISCTGRIVVNRTADEDLSLDLDSVNARYAGIILRRMGNARFIVGRGITDGSDDFMIYNAGRVENAIHINHATGVITFPNVPVGGASGYFIGGLQVVGPRDTGWSGMAGNANKATAYNTNTITLVQLAERVRAIQDAITLHGLLGP